MKRVLLIFLILSSNLFAGQGETIKINNLKVTVTGENKVQVYKDHKHMFSFDCHPYILCEIFTTTKKDPEYKMMDGVVYESADLKPLAIENIEEVIEGNANYTHGNIRFFITLTTPTAASGSTTMYTINTETGGVAEYREEWDWYRYGMSIYKRPKPQPTVCEPTGGYEALMAYRYGIR